MRPSISDRALAFFSRRTAKYAPWHKLPFAFAIPALAGIRANRRWRNLYNGQTGSRPGSLLGLKTAKGIAPGYDTAFMDGMGSACPARRRVPALFAKVWQQAIADNRP